jgi:hypothetical protein
MPAIRSSVDMLAMSASEGFVPLVVAMLHRRQCEECGCRGQKDWTAMAVLATKNKINFPKSVAGARLAERVPGYIMQASLCLVNGTAHNQAWFALLIFLPAQKLFLNLPSQLLNDYKKGLEAAGFEPATFRMQSERDYHCATPPFATWTIPEGL